MHAVQVMNLLRSLITKTLRERDETITGGYSPMSSHSSSRESDEDFDSQQDYDDVQTRYNPTSEDDDDGEVESLCEIEKCFLMQLDEKKITDNILLEQIPRDLLGECESPSKNEKSNFVINNEEEDSRRNMAETGKEIDTRIPPRRYECYGVAKSILPMHHFSSETV